MENRGARINTQAVRQGRCRGRRGGEGGDCERDRAFATTGGKVHVLGKSKGKESQDVTCRSAITTLNSKETCELICTGNN